MTDAKAAQVPAAFAAQAVWCADLGSPFTALLCETLGRRLDGDTSIGRLVLDWGGDPGGWADGVPLRLCGGLHALVRRGAALASCYPPHRQPNEETLWAAVQTTLTEHDIFLSRWLEQPPQTNEVGRAAGLMAGLLVVAAEFGTQLRLFELGASAGLNLILDRYAYDLGGRPAGDPASLLRIRPKWIGPPPPGADIEIVGRTGVDLSPIDPIADRERLIAFVWPDQPQRLAQLEAALMIAADDPPAIDRGDAGDWLEERLGIAPEQEVARVVFHSVAFQYFPARTQRRIAARIADAGAKATPQAPLAWLRFEKEAGDRKTMLRLRLYPDGEERLLAECHPHGAEMRWLAAPAPAR